MVTGDEPIYYTVAPCGCVKTIIADVPEHARDTAKELGKAVRLGETVHRGVVREVREGRVQLGWCDVCRPPKKKRRPRVQAEQQEMSL